MTANLVPHNALKGVRVALSVSDSPDLARLGLTQAHLRLAVGEVTRAVLVGDGTLAHLEPTGYTAFLAEEIQRYGKRKDRPLLICLAWQEHRRLPLSELEARTKALGLYGKIVCLDPDSRQGQLASARKRRFVVGRMRRLAAITAKSDARRAPALRTRAESLTRVAALAGRRIDAPSQHPSRFSLAAVGTVRDRLCALFEEKRIEALVSSAASGADLIALDVAGRMGVKRRVVLPSPPTCFRTTSVVDRPGDFGPAFDRVIADLEGTPDLVVLSDTEAGDSPYAATNRVILDQAVGLAGDARELLAVIVWEGRSRGEGDLTEQFAAQARAHGMEVVEIRTV